LHAVNTVLLLIAIILLAMTWREVSGWRGDFQEFQTDFGMNDAGGNGYFRIRQRP